ncbi:MAG: AMP-binding protein [Clostridium sp.]
MWNFNEFKGNLAVIDNKGNKLTYKELDIIGSEAFSGIIGKNLIFCLASNTIGSLIGYTGLVNSRQVPLMLDANIEINQLKRLIEVYKPSYIWMPVDKVKSFKEEKIIIMKYDYCLIRFKRGMNNNLHNELGLLLPTSGSTGSPKLVRQSYKNIYSNMKSIAQYLKIDIEDRPITTLPMSYTYGLSIINSHLFVGATILLTDNTIFQREFWEFFKIEKATSMGGVPYTYEMLDKLRFWNMELPFLRTMTQAGGKLQPKLHRKFAEFSSHNNIEFVVMYGQTEATARMSYLPVENTIDKCGSVGIAIPGGEFLLLDIDGKVVSEDNKVGELIYKGDNVTLGYATCIEDLEKEDENKGVLYTGDMAMRDRDGFYYIVGRKKRFLKVYGNRVNLDELEVMLKENFSNGEFACTGEDDSVDIFTTLRGNDSHIIEKVVTITGLSLRAFKINTISSIPKNQSGKIMYKELG